MGGSDNKRGGCDFHQTKMERPERAERHWLVLLVAPWWMVSVGGQADAPQMMCIRCCWSTRSLTRVPLDGRATIRKRSWHRTHRKERSWNTLRNHRNMLAAAGPFCAKD